MATTIYAESSGTPGITITRKDGGWVYTSAGFTRIAGTTTGSTGPGTWSDNFRTITGSVVGGQWIYGPIAAQTISGTVTPTIRGRTSNFVNSWVAAAAAWVAKPCGALRGTLLGEVRDCATHTWTTCMACHTMAAQTLSSVVTQNGDYLVVEGGYAAPCTFLCSCAPSLGVGNARMKFVFSGCITPYTPPPPPPPAANTVIWLGKPQPKRS